MAARSAVAGALLAAVAAATVPAAVLGDATSGALTVWPMPKSLQQAGPELVLDPSFSFVSTRAKNAYVDAGMARALAVLKAQGLGRRAHAAAAAGASPAAVQSCSVAVADGSSDLHQGTDESYTLDVSSGACSVAAETYVGALHGLQSFLQLVRPGTLAVNSTTASDAPRYAFRAFLIDTARHFYPLGYIKQHVDAMAMVKMNVLHWHIVDSQSFPYQSLAFPELSEAGAWRADHVYSQKDVAEVVEYAKARGIRVMPEFDTPGHMQAGYGAVPGLLTACYDPKTGEPDGTTGPLDPTKESTYAFLARLYAELKGVFPDQYVHVGGDEVPFDCWESNPGIAAWMKAHPEVPDMPALESYYEGRLLSILEAQNTSYMMWQEPFDNGCKVAPETIVNVWKGSHDAKQWQDELVKVAAAGYRAVLSAPWYLNYIGYGKDWEAYYKTEPEPGAGADKLFGVEACMWSEYVDPTNFVPRTWPRTAAVAERAWSPKSVANVTAAEPRLDELRCKMLRRGLRAEPIMPSYCDVEWIPPSVL